MAGVDWEVGMGPRPLVISVFISCAIMFTSRCVASRVSGCSIVPITLQLVARNCPDYSSEIIQTYWRIILESCLHTKLMLQNSMMP